MKEKKLIAELQTALLEVKTLRGILPLGPGPHCMDSLSRELSSKSAG